MLDVCCVTVAGGGGGGEPPPPKQKFMHSYSVFSAKSLSSKPTPCVRCDVCNRFNKSAI